MKKSKFVAFFVTLILITYIYPTYANDSELMQPFFTHINAFYNDFNINTQGKALLTSSIDARDGDSITISMYLQREENGSWTTVKHWTTNQIGTLAVLGESWYVVKGHKYRMLTYGYVYNDSKIIESVTHTSRNILY